MNRTRVFGVGTLLCGAALLFMGCKQENAKTPPNNEEKSKETAKAGDQKTAPGKKGEAHSDHDHGDGPHGGIVFDFGKWHGEFTVNHEKKEATVYILGGDAKKSAAIKVGTLELSIDEPKFSVELKATPVDSDEKGSSSRFVGVHENFGKEQEFSGTVTVLRSTGKHVRAASRRSRQRKIRSSQPSRNFIQGSEIPGEVQSGED